MREKKLVGKKRIRNKILSNIVEQNINTMISVQREIDRRKSFSDRVADAITTFCGSVFFLYVHILWFGLWIAINLGWLPFLGIVPFDPFPFGLLTMVVSLEAIFLSTFVLISQNRMTELSDRRADLDVQINLAAEYEITKILGLVDAIADHLGIKEGLDPELKELERTIPPEVIMKEVARRKAELGINGNGK